MVYHLTVHLPSVIDINLSILFLISALRKHDVVFLVTVRPTHPGPVKYDRTKPFREQVF